MNKEKVCSVGMTLRLFWMTQLNFIATSKLFDNAHVDNVHVDNVHADNVHVDNVHVDNVHVDNNNTCMLTIAYK